MMNTSSERYKFQELVEFAVGCSDPTQLSNYKQNVELFTVSHSNRDGLRNALRDDAVNTFYKGVLTYVDALSAVSKGYQSWAVVKLYYSVFYFIRCLVYSYEHGFVKCKGEIYTLSLSVGRCPVKRTGKKYEGENVRGDHKTAFYLFCSEFGVNDLLLSNTVDGLSVLRWLMDAREYVNYRCPVFSEPDFDFFEGSVRGAGLSTWIRTYMSDLQGVYLFQEKHCAISTPLYLLGKVVGFYKSRLGLNDILSEDQFSVVAAFLQGTGLESDSSFISMLKCD